MWPNKIWIRWHILFNLGVGGEDHLDAEKGGHLKLVVDMVNFYIIVYMLCFFCLFFFFWGGGGALWKTSSRCWKCGAKQWRIHVLTDSRDISVSEVLIHWGRVTHICVSNEKSLVQLMARRLVGAKPLSEPMWYFVNWTLGNKLRWNFNRNSYIFIQQCIWKRCLENGGHFVSNPVN